MQKYYCSSINCCLWLSFFKFQFQSARFAAICNLPRTQEETSCGGWERGRFRRRRLAFLLLIYNNCRAFMAITILRCGLLLPYVISNRCNYQFDQRSFCWTELTYLHNYSGSNFWEISMPCSSFNLLCSVSSTLCPKKAYPTFLTVSWKPIIKFW